MSADTFSRVRDVFVTLDCDPEDVQMDCRLIDLGASGVINLTELQCALVQEFDVAIPYHVAEDWTRVRDVVASINSRLLAKEVAGA